MGVKSEHYLLYWWNLGS
uniref:Uncharacterized protein n=1 Tax=Arundo donax TaxID=35708 RepID=A0A0A9E5G3_ARUDO